VKKAKYRNVHLNYLLSHRSDLSEFLRGHRETNEREKLPEKEKKKNSGKRPRSPLPVYNNAQLTKTLLRITNIVSKMKLTLPRGLLRVAGERKLKAAILYLIAALKRRSNLKRQPRTIPNAPATITNI